ncbi:MAG: hypothetical protein ACHWZW_20690 [Spirulina sp.]
MLCRSCQRQSRCLPAQFAQADATLAAMLDQLQDCGLKKTAPPNSPWLSLGRRWWAKLRQAFHRWSQRWRMGSA